MDKSTFEQAMPLTGILIQDPEVGGFTTLFAEFPEVIAEGETEEEAQRNLFSALRSILEFKREEFVTALRHEHGNLIEKPYNFELA